MYETHSGSIMGLATRSDAKEEVEDLHEYVEIVEEQNRKWQMISVGLGLLSVILGGLSVLLSTGVL